MHGECVIQKRLSEEEKRRAQVAQKPILLEYKEMAV